PVDSRLPGAIVAGLADAQAEGDEARPGRVTPGGTGRPVGQQAGEPPFARLVGVAEHPPVHPKERLDTAATEDDAHSPPLPSGGGTFRGRRAAVAARGRLGGPRPGACASPAG